MTSIQQMEDVTVETGKSGNREHELRLSWTKKMPFDVNRKAFIDMCKKELSR